MPQPSNSGFIVVECQKAPNNNNKRVCVPKSWVQCELSEEKVAIAYPAEDETRIALRIKNNEPANGAWTHYIGEIKYEAESYQDAVVGFMEKFRNGENGKQIEEKSSKNEPVAKPQDSLKLRIVVPKIKQKSEKKNKSMKKLLKEHTKNKNHKSKHKKFEKRSLKENKPDVVTNTKKETTPVVTKAAKESTPCVPKPNCQNNAGSSQKTLESKIEDIILSSVQQSLNPTNNNNNSDTSTRTPSESLELTKEIDVTNSIFTPEDKKILETIQNDQKNTLGYIRGILVSVKELYLKVIENKKSLNAIVSKYENQPLPVKVPIEEKKQNGHAFEEKNVHNGHALEEEKRQNGHAFEEDNQQNGHAFEEEMKQNGHTFEEENDLSDDMETLRFDDEMESEDETKPHVNGWNGHDDTMTNINKEENLLVERDTQMEHEVNVTDMDHDSNFEKFIDNEESSLDSLPSPPKIKKKKKNMKKKDSTWTLKHPEPGKGLVVIGDARYPVYVNENTLEKIKKSSDTIRMFARLLFKEVFTMEALQTCSMFGKPPRGNGSKPKIIRPALDSHARDRVISYSMRYGKEAGWEDIKFSTLVQGLRCVLQNCRSARNKRR